MSAEALLDDLGSLTRDPLRFVMWAFPWNEPGTELEGQLGPEPWQRSLLSAVRDGLLSFSQAVQIATASGHGVGKSATVSWLILWAMSTSPHTRGVVTANTEAQLKGKTWAELGKWYRLFIAQSLFKLTATALFNRDHDRTWRIDMVPWSESNTEAFAGLHNKGRRILVVFDEASAIPDPIWETTEGALTDANTEILWFVFGNPTRNTGRFRECFDRLRHRWTQFKVDSRAVSITNKEVISRWIDDYGLDSDFVKVRILGEFPRSGSIQFIPTDLVEAASTRIITPDKSDPLILGVDVARFGDDASVIFPRRGRDARSIPFMEFRGISTMELATRVAEANQTLSPDGIFVDEGGIGAGVVDRLRELRVPCIGVQFGSKPSRIGLEDTNEKYANKRAEMWGYMRAWLRGGAIPNKDFLRAQLTNPEYGFNEQDAIQLERKKDMKKRGLESPDHGDALALTFAFPVMRASDDLPPSRRGIESDYNPYDAERIAA